MSRGCCDNCRQQYFERKLSFGISQGRHYILGIRPGNNLVVMEKFVERQSCTRTSESERECKNIMQLVKQSPFLEVSSV